MDGNSQKKKEQKEPSSSQAQSSQYGLINVDEDVIAGIAAHAASSVNGVADRVGGMTDGISEMLGKKAVNKGVKVDQGEEMVIDLNVLVYYGYQIPQVAREIQEAVFDQIKTMLDVDADIINVYVQGLVFPDDENPKSLEESP